MKVRRKSLHRSTNGKRARKRANQRAAKARKRLAGASAPDHGTHSAPVPALTPSGFRITIECLDDHERVQFVTARGPHGLTTSATECGRKVASVLRHYLPENAETRKF